MAMTTRERSNIKAALASQDYYVGDIDLWPAKTTLYRHKPQMNGDVIVKDVGTYITNVPGSPQYVLAKSKIGLLQWPPSETCKCKWCAERKLKKTEASIQEVDKNVSIDTSNIVIEPSS